MSRITATNRMLINLSLLTAAMIFALAGCDGLLDPDEAGNLVPRTVSEDPRLPRILINGTSLHAEAFGDIHDPILVFLHGGPGSDYRAFISQFGNTPASRYPEERTVTGGLSQLKASFYCVFFDQRGGGLSPRFDQGEVDFDLLVSDLDAVISHYIGEKLDETGVEDSQVYLMGWSYGGMLATGYINSHPERVRDVVLYEPAPLASDVWDYLKENSENPFTQIGEDWMDEYLLSHDHITSDAHERADYQALLGANRSQPEFHEHPDTPMWRTGAVVGGDNVDFIESDSYDITSNIDNMFQGNMLLIVGALTLKSYPQFPEMQRSFYPRSEFVTIAGVGHTGVWEKPDEIADEIRSFFAR
ncbi:alpha/beta hydrolase [bacterium]|nr:alpha/beta hydrolase [bacterium]